MKKWLFILSLSLVLTGCYDDYVKDYSTSGIYVAYQYDLRTFVIGEGMQFDFTVGLGGVIDNTCDRKVKVAIDEALVGGDLSMFADDATPAPFTALDGMLGNAPIGALSQGYVTTDVKAQKLAALTPLPASYYTRPAVENMVIRKGAYTASVTIKADSAQMLADPQSFKPYYALAFRIEQADADMVPMAKSFSVIAVRCENTFYGNYYHGGKSIVRNNLTGDVVSQDVYPTTVPETNNNRIYVLSTASANSVTTNRAGNAAGKLRLTFEGENIRVAFVDHADRVVEPMEDGCKFNNARLLQNRKLFLNYKFDNGNGTTTFVQDTLSFRNRMRDGINEWQDENPEHYK